MSKELALLEKLISAKTDKREKRSLNLLRSPTGDHPANWRLFLPRSFNSALDIAQTERVVTRCGTKQTVLQWTQGSTFAFGSGDIIYDTEEAYLPWAEAINKFRWCVEVVRAAPSSPQQKDSPRYPGSVSIKISRPDGPNIGLVEVGRVETTQDDFVRFVIGGDVESLANIFV